MVNFSKIKFYIDWCRFLNEIGAYYYWLTETGKNYEDTMIDVVANSIAEEIPYK